jgi:hypothetical protein
MPSITQLPLRAVARVGFAVFVLPQVAAAFLSFEICFHVDGLDGFVVLGKVVVMAHSGCHAVAGAHVVADPFGHSASSTFGDDPVLVTVVKVSIDSVGFGVVVFVAWIPWRCSAGWRELAEGFASRSPASADSENPGGFDDLRNCELSLGCVERKFVAQR